jgi:hypothetical protein
MGTFVNDSGVIIASHNNEVIRFEKDGLQIFTDNKNVVLVSIQQNQRIERRYLASAISSPSNSGADDLKRKLFLMLEDYGAGGGDGVTDLQGAYDGGNVVNGNTVTLNYTAGPDHIKIGIGFEALLNATGTAIIGIGRRVLKDSTANPIIAIGLEAGRSSSGSSIVAIGTNSCLNNTGNNVVGIGIDAGRDNTGLNVVGIGTSAGRKNTSTNSNFLGTNAGYDSIGDTGNTTSFGVTVFSPESIPSYANKGAAETALTVANGCVAGQIYLFRNEANDNIGFIIPSA